MCTSVYTGLNLCNFIRKHFLQICCEMSINFLLLSLDGLPILSVSNTKPISWNFSANCSYTKSVYLLPSWKKYTTIKTRCSIERTIVSKNWIKQLHNLPVLHFNRCLTTEYSETTAHFNTDNQIYVL
jgi:hypothetical protein